MYRTKNGKHRSDLFPQIDRVLNEIFNTTIDHAADEVKNKFSQPSANVQEYKDRFEVHLAIPGMEKKDIDVKIAKNVLTISSDADLKEDGKFKLKEYAYGKFSRKFKLPETLDLDTVDAKLKNGILTIAIAKKTEEVDRGPLEIKVQ